MVYTVKQCRVGMNLTQKKMAEALKISAHTYAKYEKSPELMTIKLAKSFSEVTGISIEDILFAN